MSKSKRNVPTMAHSETKRYRHTVDVIKSEEKKQEARETK
jgi:hypothetical protein